MCRDHPGLVCHAAALSWAGKYQFDLAGFARYRLAQMGITEVRGGDICCAADQRFYSYRRDGVTGRMASLIWLT